MTEDITTFDGLCNRAVKAFMQSVVVIDNEASLNSDNSRNPIPPVNAARKRTTAPGMVKANPTENFKDDKEKLNAEASNNEEEPEAHRLELNKVSQAFAEQELTCGVYLPTEQDPAGMEELIRATVQAIRPTDACILDWQLRKGDSTPAIKSIKKVIQRDKEEGGRLRLILIYTAEKLDDAFPVLQTALEDEKYQVTVHDLEDGPVIASDHFRIVFINKPTRMWNQEGAAAVVQWKDLPQRIIREFTILSRGLLRAFALESVAAVRRDIHRILAQFDEDLDPVYAGDRATKPDPSDASNLIVELLCSELNYTLSHSKGAQESLAETGLMLWLKTHEAQGSFRDDTNQFKVGEVDVVGLNAETRSTLLKSRAAENGTWVNEKSAVRVRKNFFSDDEKAETASLKLASLSTLVRTASLGVAPPDGVRLRFGTIVRLEQADENETKKPDETEQHESMDKGEVFLCLQPSCDTARINGERPFLFVKLVPDHKRFQLPIPEGTGFSHWRLPEKDERFILTPTFPASDQSGVVLAKKGSACHSFYFSDVHGRKWFWLADLRDLTAVTMRDEALQPFSRVGVNSLEWLRLRGTKGK